MVLLLDRTVHLFWYPAVLAVDARGHESCAAPNARSAIIKVRTTYRATAKIFSVVRWCLRYLLLVMCTHPFAKEALTLHLERSEGHQRYFGCNLMHRRVLASSHQHLMAEAPRPLAAKEPVTGGEKCRVRQTYAQR